ncbi:MAG: hypothetical protein EXS05_03495 [Planctomycetaceae bacterium]|nr:hypothetical protein [Planctomycetaceae bacterium]
MVSPDDCTPYTPGPDEETALREILGYLNFSNGSPDVRFQQNFNGLASSLSVAPGSPEMAPLLTEGLARLQRELSAFRDSEQARLVVSLVYESVLPAYRAHHADLLNHLSEGDFQQPFFVVRVIEAVLAEGAPWGDVDRIVAGALSHLNDFIGHRPVAVLENGRQMLPYPHERFRPFPWYIRQAGVAVGKHHDLIEQALTILDRLPPDLLAGAYFDRSLLDELALDERAYDHSHPVYKRTNYTFGEWDPHCLDVSGRYRRFVVRAVILDALRDWMQKSPDISPEERLCEAGAVLAGTILMASSVSGSGPDTHDSNVSLTSLLPRIARQRDAFYTRLLQTLAGAHGDRLRKEAQLVQQPFGRIRQHLNLYLAHYGCRQMQRAHLAFLYAHMGYSQAARDEAAVIPSTATRFETEIQLRLTLVQLDLDRGRIDHASELCAEAEQLLHRGIECGGLVDPWNILGFQGQFPLFAAREDSVPDQRVDKLLALMEQFFNGLSRLSCEAAASGDARLSAAISERFGRVAEFWDRFATPTISDLPTVNGGESYQSASRVTRALLAWHDAGEASGDVAFWKQHVDEFQSPRSYAIVVELLLRKRDTLASMNLLIQWLSQSESVPLEAGAYSFFGLLTNWIELVLKDDPDEAWPLVRKFFDYVEVNAGQWIVVPTVQPGAAGSLRVADATVGLEPQPATDPIGGDSPFSPEVDEVDDDDDASRLAEDPTFSAAYESVVYRDSAQDGHFGDTVDESAAQFDTDLDLICQPIELRLRFLVALSQSWRSAGEWGLAPKSAASSTPSSTPSSTTAAVDNAAERQAAVRHWERLNEQFAQGGVRLMDDLSRWNPLEPEGDPDSLSEFDRQLHVKFSLVNSVISACVELHESGQTLKRLTRQAVSDRKPRAFDDLVSEMLSALAAKDAVSVRRYLPPLLKELSRLPLLYVPLDRDGQPREILAARNLQSLLRQLLSSLPQLGLFRETWHLLRTAYVMERTSPPGGMSITEFDRLLEAALQSTLECLIAASADWLPAQAADEHLVRQIERVLEVYLRLWLKHSATMRLSSAETLKDPAIWRRVKAFVRKYGGDLFHPRMLTMGNLRGIVQRGADAYLEYLAENEDPLHPIELLHDLEGPIARTEAAFLLETILRCVVEKFDRFLEYNTTTTQSDYGEQLYCLLDFLRLEAEYERQAWNLAPLELAHEVLSRQGRTDAATLWEANLTRKTAAMGRSFLQKLKRLERQHGMRLPSVTDRLSERFVKPLALDRILALVRPAMLDGRADQPGENFRRLQTETEAYLSTTSGSALEIQPWLQSLSDEVQHVESELAVPESAELKAPVRLAIPLTLSELTQQLAVWEKPLDGGPAA